MHINGVGGDCPGKQKSMLTSCVWAQFLRIRATIAHRRRYAANASRFPVTELWTVLSGKVVGVAVPDQVTIFDSVGFALEDYSALRYMRDAAMNWV